MNAKVLVRPFVKIMNVCFSLRIESSVLHSSVVV